MDGTLVDSEKLKGKALVKTCSIFGGTTHIGIYKIVMGKSWEEVATFFFEKAQINPAIEEFNAEFKPIYKEILFHELATNPNAVELLFLLKKTGKRIGVVSSAFSWMVNQVLSQLELCEYFDVIITQENVAKHKPDPEAYLLALEKLSLPASEVLIFEDSESGLIAAQKANCDSVAFQHEFNINHDFSLATQVISDYNELFR